MVRAAGDRIRAMGGIPGGGLRGAAAGFVLLAGAACGGEAAAGHAGDRLVLEVGGEQSSLREALRAAGATSAPGDAQTESNGERNATTRDAPPVPPPEPPPPAWFEVTLADGDTPIHLARRHLGDANRFREILALNGWDEGDARRLRAGQKVKIPASARAGRVDRR